jgi:HEAT repeat protein
VGRFLGYLVFLAALAVGAAWYSQWPNGWHLRPPENGVSRGETEWLRDLYSQNPREAEEAAAKITSLGERAIPILRSALATPSVDHERKKAALKACALLEHRAAPLVPEVAALLRAPELTEEAAVALSYMGRGAFAPLRQALDSRDPALRREAIRSIGKLKSRAPLDPVSVTPLLVEAMDDVAPAVRAVAATYLGIIHEDPEAAVPALIEGLEDPDIDVRKASATALGSFGEAAQPAVPALRKAAGDPDGDLAREAGLALIKLQPAQR